MSIRYIPARPFLDPQERLTYPDLALLAGGGTATVEPEGVGLSELKEDEVIPMVQAIPTGSLSGTLTVAEAVTIPSKESAILGLLDVVDSPAGVTSVDTVVRCDQRDSNLYFTGYIENVPDGIGGTKFRMRFVAKNHGTASHDVSIGQLIRYTIFTGQPSLSPRTPNATLIVTPSQVWLDALTGDPIDPNVPLTADSLNRSALPTFATHQNSFTAVELRAHDIGLLGSLYTGKRAIFTVPTTTSVPLGAAVLLGTVNISDSPGVNVAIGQVAPTPIFTGYVSASNGTTTISIYARNNTSFTLSVPEGLVLKVFNY